MARATNLTRALEAYQKAGLHRRRPGRRRRGRPSTTWTRCDGPVVIVVGSEGKGLSRLVGETCDLRVRIPMPGGAAESLNAGVAAGVVLYEAARRRM